jgi:hypothetical protein
MRFKVFCVVVGDLLAKGLQRVPEALKWHCVRRRRRVFSQSDFILTTTQFVNNLLTGGHFARLFYLCPVNTAFTQQTKRLAHHYGIYRLSLVITGCIYN